MGGACILDTPPKSYIPSVLQLSVERELMSSSWWIPSLHLAHSPSNTTAQSNFHPLYQKSTQQNAFKLPDNCQCHQNEILQKQHNSFQGRRFCFNIGRAILKFTKPVHNASTYTVKLPVKADQFFFFRVFQYLSSAFNTQNKNHQRKHWSLKLLKGFILGQWPSNCTSSLLLFSYLKTSNVWT